MHNTIPHPRGSKTLLADDSNCRGELLKELCAERGWKPLEAQPKQHHARQANAAAHKAELAAMEMAAEAAAAMAAAEAAVVAAAEAAAMAAAAGVCGLHHA